MDCPDTYVGKTKRNLITRFNEHLDVKKVSAVKNHIMESNHDFQFDDVRILARESADTELLIKESLIIKRTKPKLNDNVVSYPLEMF